MTETDYIYRRDGQRTPIALDDLVGLVREGAVDLDAAVIAPGGHKAPLAGHPAIVDRLLEDVDSIQAPELRQRLAEGQCLHCHRKGAARYLRRRVNGFLWICRDLSGWDFACDRCRARALNSDLLATTWLGWWGLPAAGRSFGAIAASLRQMTGRGEPVGVLRGLGGLFFAVSPILAIALALFLFYPRPTMSDGDLAAIELDQGVRSLDAGEHEAARQHFAEAARLDPAWSDPHWLLARSHLETGQYEEALIEARLASRLIEGLDVDPRKRVAVHGLHAHVAQRAGQTTEAIDILGRLVESAPDDLVLHRRYQDLLIEDGRRDEARVAYRRRAEADGAPADAFYLAGRVETEPPLVLIWAERALDVDPHHVDGLLLAAASLGDLGRWQESAARARTAREVEPDLPEAVRLEARAVDALGEPGAAVRLLEDAVSRMPRAVRLRLDLAGFLRGIEAPNRYDRARDVLRIGKRYVDDDPYLLHRFEFERALVEREAGAFDEALSVLATVRQARGLPESLVHDAALESVLTLVEAGRLTDAIEASNAVRETLVDPVDRARLDVWVGVALVESGQAEQARTLWRAVLDDLGPVDPGSDRVPAAALRFLLGGLDGEAELRAALPAGLPGLVNNVEFVVGLAHHLAGDEAGARSHFEASLASTRGHNFPWFTIRRWAGAE